LLKATVGAEFLDEAWHPASPKCANSTENVAVRLIAHGGDRIDLVTMSPVR
jgi:hypothetical protein